MSAHIRLMRTVNPAPGEGAWAVTRVNENGRPGYGKLEIVKEYIDTERQAYDLGRKLAQGFGNGSTFSFRGV